MLVIIIIITIITSNHDSIYNNIIYVKAIVRVHLGHLNECGCQLIGQAANFATAIRCAHFTHGRLSWPGYCSKCAACAQCCVLQQFFFVKSTESVCSEGSILGPLAPRTDVLTTRLWPPAFLDMKCQAVDIVELSMLSVETGEYSSCNIHKMKISFLYFLHQSYKHNVVFWLVIWDC